MERVDDLCLLGSAHTDVNIGLQGKLGVSMEILRPLRPIPLQCHEWSCPHSGNLTNEAFV